MAPLLELLAKVDPAPGCCGWRVVVAGRRWNVGSNLDGRHHGLRWCAGCLRLFSRRQSLAVACPRGGRRSPFRCSVMPMAAKPKPESPTVESSSDRLQKCLELICGW